MEFLKRIRDGYLLIVYFNLGKKKDEDTRKKGVYCITEREKKGDDGDDSNDGDVNK